MEDRQLDKIFKSGLEAPLSYDGKDRQWKEISSALHGPKKSTFRKILFVFLPILFLGSSFWVLSSSSEPKLEQKSNQVTEENIGMVEGDDKIQSAQTEEIESLGFNHNPIQFEEIVSTVGNDNEQEQENRKQEKQNILTTNVQGKSLNRIEKEATENTDSASQIFAEQKEKEECLPCEEEENAMQAAQENASSIISFEGEQQQTSVERYKTSATKINISPVKTLDIQSLTNIDATLPLVDIFSRVLPVTKLEGRKRFNLRLGIEKDSSVSSASSIRPFIGLGYNFSERFSIQLQYTQDDIQKTILEDWEKYNIPIEEPTDPSVQLDSVSLSYQRKIVDFSLESIFWQNNNLAIGLSSGMKMNRAGLAKLEYVFDTTYAYTSEEKTQAANWFLQDVYVGPFVQVKLDTFSLVGQYNYNKNLKHNSYRWHNTHRYKIGLNFNF